ncbi:MAG: hypothetical protein KAH10_01745 [Flavobacteriales bacterium]|nr:hypothetical protein [Flavobacteriales bacterium]
MKIRQDNLVIALLTISMILIGSYRTPIQNIIKQEKSNNNRTRIVSYISPAATLDIVMEETTEA